jgi:hypothetical protein
VEAAKRPAQTPTNKPTLNTPRHQTEAGEKPASVFGPERSLTITIGVAAGGQVASLSVGLAKLFDGPLDDQRLALLDRRLKDLLAIEGGVYDAFLVRAPNNLKFEELIRIFEICSKQKSADGKPIKRFSFAELAPNSDKPGDDSGAKPQSSSQIPGLSELPVVGPLFDKQDSAGKSVR